MLWAAIITSLGCILLFSNVTTQWSQTNHGTLSSWKLNKTLKVVGIAAILLSGVFWSLLAGALYGFGLLIGCAAINFIVCKVLKPKADQLIGVAATLIGASFIVTTVSMLNELI